MKYFCLFLTISLSLGATVNISSAHTSKTNSPTFQTAQTPLFSNTPQITTDWDCDQPGGNCRQQK
jgi:hypothetical protein